MKSTKKSRPSENTIAIASEVLRSFWRRLRIIGLNWRGCLDIELNCGDSPYRACVGIPYIGLNCGVCTSTMGESALEWQKIPRHSDENCMLKKIFLAATWKSWCSGGVRRIGALKIIWCSKKIWKGLLKTRTREEVSENTSTLFQVIGRVWEVQISWNEENFYIELNCGKIPVWA